MRNIYLIYILMLLGITNSMLAQNNAINLVNNSNYYLIGLNSFLGSQLNLDINNFTIEYNFYLNNSSNYNGRFYAGYNNYNQPGPLDFYIDNTGASFLRLGNDVTFETITGTPTFNTGQWYHVAFVVNNTATKNIKMFVNGISVIDFNFSQSLNINYIVGIIALGSLTNNAGDCKFDNLRLWNTLRTDMEISNNYNNCLNNTETSLIVNMDFDRSNLGITRNRVASSDHKNGITYTGTNTMFSSGTGCSTPEIAPSLNVTGSYSGIYYVIGYLNGKPHYKTDEIVCNFFTSPTGCEQSYNKAFEIFWNTNEWVLKPAGCYWEFTSCENEDSDPYNPTVILATNSSNTNFAPCSGWSFTDTNANSMFSSTDCAALSINNFEFEKNISVYPNPSSGIFNINTDKEIEIRVFDVLGKEIIIKNINSKTIDISNYPKGVYYLEASFKSGEKSLYKLVKK
ncbi:MAG: T9SS type A sorting domain-containing protein [Flavobacterium sp.]|nr:T9SS type A sorting domain-containing protein [Flavobacterium sp.]